MTPADATTEDVARARTAPPPPRAARRVRQRLLRAAGRERGPVLRDAAVHRRADRGGHRLGGVNSSQLHLGFAWDVYPFIALNLLFSLQAAYAAPLILLAQTRQADRDKLHSELVDKSHGRLEQAAKAETDKLLALLESNTELTRQDKELTEQVADAGEADPRAAHGGPAETLT